MAAGGQRHAVIACPRERDTVATVGPMAGLDGCEKPCLYRHSIP